MFLFYRQTIFSQITKFFKQIPSTPKNERERERETNIEESESDLPREKHIVLVSRKVTQAMKLLVPLNDAVLVDLELDLLGEVSGYRVPAQGAEGRLGTLPLNLKGQSGSFTGTFLCTIPHQITTHQTPHN